jgi:hypothetical protein
MTKRKWFYIRKKKLKKIGNRIKDPVNGNGNNAIYPLLSTWITTWKEPGALYEYSS